MTGCFRLEVEKLFWGWCFGDFWGWSSSVKVWQYLDFASAVSVNGCCIMIYMVCVTLVTAKKQNSCSVRIRARVTRMYDGFPLCLAIAYCRASSLSRISSFSSLSRMSSFSSSSRISSSSSPSRKPLISNVYSATFTSQNPLFEIFLANFFSNLLVVSKSCRTFASQSGRKGHLLRHNALS